MTCFLLERVTGFEPAHLALTENKKLRNRARRLFTPTQTQFDFTICSVVVTILDRSGEAH